MKVVHLAYNHRYNDIRIFEKECVSLAKNGYDAVYITSSKNSPIMDRQKSKGVEIIIIPITNSNRYIRMIKFLQQAYKEALSQNADVYHIHEVWYLPLIFKLKKRGKVIFDSHEDHPRDIFAGKMRKQRWWERICEKIFEAYERICVKNISGIIAVTPHIAEQFRGVSSNIAVIENYPVLEEFCQFKHNQYNSRIIFYGGGISEANGILNIIEAMEDIDGTLVLAGDMSSTFQSKAVQMKGWSKVKALGYITQEEIKEWYLRCNCGIVLYLPVENSVEALPNKLFEYMASSVPVVVSNFDVWKYIVRDNQCGICVDPCNKTDISEAINYIFDNPDEAERMGEKGRKLVLEKYNWNVVEKRLLEFYKNIFERME